MTDHDFSALGFNPAPGDPDRGQQMASTLRTVTNALEEIKDVVTGEGDQSWQGLTAQGFHDLMGEEFKPRISDAYESFSAASRALDRWVHDLDGFQSRARALEREAEDVRAEVESRQSFLGLFGDRPEDEAKAREYDDDKDAARRALDNSQAALADIVRRANTLAGEADSSAQTTVRLLQDARDVAPDEPGLWDKITGALGDLGEFLGDVVEYVKDNWWNILHQIVSITATVLAVASLFFPALAPFALAFALADVAMSGIDWARGVPGAKEAFLTGAIGLAGGAAFGKLASSFMKAAGPSLQTGMFRVVAQGGGGGGAIAAPVAAALQFNPTFGPALAGYLFIRAKDANDASEGLTALLGGNAYYMNDLRRGWDKARAN